jgi:hypothetical protein
MGILHKNKKIFFPKLCRSTKETLGQHNPGSVKLHKKDAFRKPFFYFTILKNFVIIIYVKR